ncbi:MAG: M14 family metallopeptidase [Rikenellaceae bacterium]
MKKLTFLSLVLLILPAILFAQPTGEKIDYFLPEGEFTYNPKITTPAEFLGYEIGDQHVTTYEIYKYLEHLSQQTDRFTYEYHGKTYENRKLMYVTVTSPENHKDIDTILEEHQKISDPTYSGDLDFDSMPIVIWLGYSIHGNEASGIQSALAVSYFLAAAEGEEMDKIMSNSVIVVHPIINPDGSDRFATWVNAARSFTNVSDPNSREFSEAWPGGRSNHYWFDLNRDVLHIQHPESRSKVDMYLKFRPNIVNDHHEQGSDQNFYYMPGAQSRNNPLTHKDNWPLTKAVSKYHEAELDNIQTMYYTEEGFDDYYYGKGSTYPDIHGAVGMLFEQGSARGHYRMTKNGILTLAMAARNQAYTSFSTIRAAMGLKSELLKLQYDTYKENYTKAQNEKVAGYVFGGKDTRGVNYEVLKVLLGQQLDVYRLGEEITSGDKKYSTEDSYFVPIAQRDAGKLNTLFENVLEFPDSAFYDITGWTLSEAANLNMIKAKSASKGEKLSKAELTAGEVIGGKSKFGYFFRTNEYYSHKVIYALQKAGLSVEVANKPFEYQFEGQLESFNSGTILVQVPMQNLSEDAIYSLISKLSKENGVDIYSAESGAGHNTQLGSGRFAMLRMPKVAVVVGSGVDSRYVGDAWFVLDNRLEMPMAHLDMTRLSAETLQPYNTLLVTGDFSMSAGTMVALKAWVNNGGTLITLGTAWRTANNLGLTNLIARENIYASSADASPKPYEQRSVQSVGKAVAGVILNAEIDTTHPLMWGYDQSELSVFHVGTTFFKDIKDKYNVPARYTGDVICGYVSNDNVKNLSDSPSILMGSAGRGRVVVLNSNPNFRAFWVGTQKIFFNSIFFAPVTYASKLESVDAE